MQVETIFSDLPTLETQRLMLRKIALEDADDRFRFLSDELVTRFLPFGPHKTRDETVNGIRYILDLYAKGQLSPWGIVQKETGRSIGTIGYATWSVRHGRAEIYYHLAREAWGKGLTVEAAREVIRFGFEHMELNRVEAYVSPENVASQRVAEKLGMHSEGLIRESFNIKGIYKDHLLYALLRREWAHYV